MVESNNNEKYKVITKLIIKSPTEYNPGGFLFQPLDPPKIIHLSPSGKPLHSLKPPLLRSGKPFTGDKSRGFVRS